MTRKPVTYRKFKSVDGAWPPGQLDALCSAALETIGPNGNALKDDWIGRRFPAADLADHFRFSHSLNRAEGSLFEMLCLYSPSEYIAMIKEEAKTEAEKRHVTLDEAMKQVSIAEAAPPVGESYLKGHAYFLIRGDHVFMIQHTSLRASALETYLHNLLTSASVVSINHTFILDGALALSADGHELGEVLSVEVGGVPAAPPPPSASDVQVTDHDAHEQLGRVRSTQSKGKQIMDLLLGSTRSDQIMEAIPVEAELEVDVRFGFKARKRRINRAALSQIASAARDLPEGQVKAIGRDGKASGGDLRLATDMPFRRLRENGALLDLENAREQLLKVYARFVEDGKITP